MRHIFIRCPHTISFLKQLKTFILRKIDPLYRDNNLAHFILLNHSTDIVNYLNLAAKWYISKQFQLEKPLIWQGFVRLVRLALTGEKQNIKSALRGTMF